jgi:prepilin-type N-terminal cleavage/methylation domain-containing protein
MTMAKRWTTSCRRASPKTRGFTLVEVLVATAIMGMLFVALMEAFKVGLQMLEYSQRVTIASSLAEEIHQMTLTLPLDDPESPGAWGLELGEGAAPYDDVDDLDGLVFTPPVNADGMAIAGLGDYQQEVTVVSVSDQDFDQVVGDGTSGVSRVTVLVTCQGDEVCRMSWLVVGPM